MDLKKLEWPLPNLKKIEATEFWHHASCWALPQSTYVERQKDQDSQGWFTPVTYVVNHGKLTGGGFVVKCYYSGPRAGQQDFFTWCECDHDFEHKSGGNCYHIYTCKKCGARYDVDSSD